MVKIVWKLNGKTASCRNVILPERWKNIVIYTGIIPALEFWSQPIGQLIDLLPVNGSVRIAKTHDKKSTVRLGTDRHITSGNLHIRIVGRFIPCGVFHIALPGNIPVNSMTAGEHIHPDRFRDKIAAILADHHIHPVVFGIHVTIVLHL